MPFDSTNNMAVGWSPKFDGPSGGTEGDNSGDAALAAVRLGVSQVFELGIISPLAGELERNIDPIQPGLTFNQSPDLPIVKFLECAVSLHNGVGEALFVRAHFKLRVEGGSRQREMLRLRLAQLRKVNP